MNSNKTTSSILNVILHIFVVCRYVDDLFKLDSSMGSGNLKQFEEVINQETFWVATEILKEPNALKRMKTIKHFIKIALHCRECKNFNSMFAIIRYAQHGSCLRVFSFVLLNQVWWHTDIIFFVFVLVIVSCARIECLLREDCCTLLLLCREFYNFWLIDQKKADWQPFW